MSDVDALGELELFVRDRLRLALHDKALFERHGQRLNSQLMQGEINMGTAVLAWIERHRQGADTVDDDDDAAESEPDA